jgi:M6 family metalloprotease-like protein
VKVSGNAKKYASTATHDENSQYLVQDIMEVLKTRDIDWSLYDWNGDGFVNQLLIIYAGKGQNAGGGDDTIWPHQWWISEHLKDLQQDVYCDPIPVTYGKKQYMVDSYCCVQEDVNGSSVKTSFGTICHEYSHCFGFPDFYRGSKKYVSDWDLMDSGNYNDKGFCPACYSAHERWLMGWLTPTELEYDRTVTNMPALVDEGVAYLIRNEGYADEYYIVENRQQTGWDSNLPGSGIIIFHIDYDPSIWTSIYDTPNSSKIQRYTIFKADDGWTVSDRGWAYPYLGNDSLTNLSTPAATLNKENTDGTKLMNKSLYDMTVEGGLASFRFVDGPVTGVDVVKPAGTPQLLYRLGSVSILRYPNGVVKKVVRGERDDV